jgi:CheY-like chemotaxis protein
MARILIAEDDLLLREWLSEIMLGAGHRVELAGDGLQALSIFNRENVDLVVTDISMPNEDGLGLIRRIRKARPEVKIIVLSGLGPDCLEDALLLGAHAIFGKPVRAQAILQCILDLLSHRERASPRYTPCHILDTLCEDSSTMPANLRGPFVLSDTIIDCEVLAARPGAFVLTETGAGIKLRVAYVGRSDSNVNNQLHAHVGSYAYFSYVYASTAQEAFEAQCALYHDFELNDNPTHPLRPKGENWTCPRCKLFG